MSPAGAGGHWDGFWGWLKDIYEPPGPAAHLCRADKINGDSGFPDQKLFKKKFF